MKDIENILIQKGQIILQGPPGTGKTFSAEKLARQLTLRKTITHTDILKEIVVGKELKSSSNRKTYVVDEIAPNAIKLRLENGSINEAKFSDILTAFKNRIWENGDVTNGNDSYDAAVAKYLHNKFKEEQNNEQVKLIQFHPAYSYEDFVRGITVENKDSQIEYITKNKVLGEFAQAAHENYINSQKTGESISKENWAKQEWLGFADSIRQETEQLRPVPLNTNVLIKQTDDTAFYYTGSVWAAERPHRMKFADLLTAFLEGAETRQDIIASKAVSGSARQHATYYLLVLNKFKEYLSTRPKYQQSVAPAEELKNYVLIIDEINRANLPAVLGELIYALEYRGKPVESMYDMEGDNTLILPKNLFIIGTMNTADRSVGHIDYAIRRRFAFKNVLPNLNVVHSESKNLFKKVSELFIKNFDTIDWNNPQPQPSAYIASDFNPEDVWIGHSYFMSDNSNLEEAKKELKLKLEFEIKPLLKEYVKDGLLVGNITKDGALNSLDYIQKLTL